LTVLRNLNTNKEYEAGVISSNVELVTAQFVKFENIEARSNKGVERRKQD